MHMQYTDEYCACVCFFVKLGFLVWSVVLEKKAMAQDMNDISLPDFHLRFVDNLESMSNSQQEEMLLDTGVDT